MRLVVLTAGRATRLGDAAPHGCKALVPLGGRPIIEWQIDAVAPSSVTVVCRSTHAPLLERYGDVAIDDTYRGAAHALHQVQIVDEPTIVAFADTFFTALPDGEDWCGTHTAPGGRYWDVADELVLYRYVRPDHQANVCVGLYRFDDMVRLDHAVHRSLRLHLDEIGMGPVVNRYGLAFADVPSWQDVGDVDALDHFRLPTAFDDWHRYYVPGATA